MASVKESNTSKTAHVLNLLSRNKSSAPLSQADASVPSDAQAHTAPPEQQVPPIITSLRSDSEVSAKIQEALEASFPEENSIPEKDDSAHTSVPEADGTPAAVDMDSVDPSHVHFSIESDQESGTNATVPPLEEPESHAQMQADIPELSLSPAASEAPHDAALSSASSDLSICPVSPGQSHIRVNIMQMLVDEKVDKYISLFGLCTCDRCKSDAAALALTNLPPKYVVMSEAELSPRLTVYEGRFNAAVTAQILRACKEVFEHPRHSEAQ